MTFNELADCLDAAVRGLHEDIWTQNTMARNRDREPVNVNHSDACRWCAMGYFEHMAHLRGFSEAEVDGLYIYALPQLGYHGSLVVDANDNDGLEDARTLLADIAREARRRGDDEVPNRY